MSMESGPLKEASLFNSKASLVASKFRDYLKLKKISTDQFNSWEEVSDMFSKTPMMLKLMTQMKVSMEELMTELKNSNIVSVIPPPPPSSVKEPKKLEVIETQYQTLPGLRSGEEINDPRIQKQVEEALLVKEVENIFLDPKGQSFEDVYQKSKELSKHPSTENDDYYRAFAQAGLVGEADVTKDLSDLRQTKEKIELEKQKLSQEEILQKEISYKISEIVENALVVASDEWFEGDIEIDTTPEWVDVKKGIDDILRIKSDGQFLGLGIDATYNGLLSVRYKEKFQNMLYGIRGGHKNQVKYFKDHSGKMLPEFTVAKNVLFLDFKDVKIIVHFIKHFDDAKIRNEFKENPLKYKILSQMIMQSELLQDFAEKYKNDIQTEYGQFLSSIRKWLLKHKDIATKVNEIHDEKIKSHMKFLINDFEKNR